MSERNPADLLKPLEVAVFLNVSVSSVYRWVAAGRLFSFRIGSEHGRIRIPFFAIEEFLKRHLTDSLAGDAVGVEREQQVDA